MQLPREILENAKRTQPELLALTHFAPMKEQAGLQVLLVFYAELKRILTTINEPMVALVRVVWWREALEKFQATGTSPPHELFPHMEKAMHLYDLPVSCFLTMLEAAEDTIDGQTTGKSLTISLFTGWLHITAGIAPLLTLANAWDNRFEQPAPIVLDKETEQRVWKALAYSINWIAKQKHAANSNIEWQCTRYKIALLWADVTKKI